MECLYAIGESLKEKIIKLYIKMLFMNYCYKQHDIYSIYRLIIIM